MAYIYCLKNPTSQEVFYIGCTETSLQERLKLHYIQLRSALRGERNMNKRFYYLSSLLPLKTEIHLLEEVSTDIMYEREKHFISVFRAINPNLTNMTDGGRGQHTSKYFDSLTLQSYAAKISTANKGRPKPAGFSENLSAKRKGLDNPAAKPIQRGGLIITNDFINFIHFTHGFQTNEFLNNGHAYSNFQRTANRKENASKTPYGYTVRYFDEWDNDIQLKATSYTALSRVRTPNGLTIITK